MPARRKVSNNEGSAAVEFALLAMPLLVLIIGAIQLAIVIWTQQMVETTAEALGRRILTGAVQKQSLTKAQFASLACSLLPATMTCAKLILDVQVATSFSTATTSKPVLTGVGNPTAATVMTYNVGTPGQIVVLRVLYALPVVALPGLNLQSSSSTFGFSFPMATSVFKNEIGS